MLQFIYDLSDRQLERDTAILEGQEALNNHTIKKYSPNSQARLGCKGKSKFCFGYKGLVGVDMRSGLIETVVAIPENLSDQAGFKHISPRDGQIIVHNLKHVVAIN